MYQKRVITISILNDKKNSIKKPYTLSILLAKVKTVLKRYGNSSSKQEEILEFGQIQIDTKLHRVRVNNVDIQLKSMEYKLLSYLVKNKNRIISKDELFQNVWGDSFVADDILAPASKGNFCRTII